MIKIVHIADIHLDFPFASLTATERCERRRELREALAEACSVCKNEDIDIMLIAGDLFESDYICPETPAFAASCFASIPDTQIFISPGNHDPYSARSPYRSASFSDNVHIFTEEKLSYFDIPALNTTVYGFAFEQRSIRGNPIEKFTVADPDRINLLCAHCELDVSSPKYCGISAESIKRSGLNYAALGHIHAPSGLKKYGRTVCAYSGCLVGHGFDECGKRGMVIGDINAGNVSLKYREIGKRRYEAVSIPLEGCPSDAEILKAIHEKCDDFDSMTALRVVLCGNVSSEITLTGKRLRAELPAPFSAELINETVFIPDISELLKEQSLRGEFCRKLLPYLQSDSQQERKKAALALKYGIAALQG